MYPRDPSKSLWSLENANFAAHSAFSAPKNSKEGESRVEAHQLTSDSLPSFHPNPNTPRTEIRTKIGIARRGDFAVRCRLLSTLSSEDRRREEEGGEEEEEEKEIEGRRPPVDIQTGTDESVFQRD